MLVEHLLNVMLVTDHIVERINDLLLASIVLLVLRSEAPQLSFYVGIRDLPLHITTHISRWECSLCDFYTVTYGGRWLANGIHWPMVWGKNLMQLVIVCDCLTPHHGAHDWIRISNVGKSFEVSSQSHHTRSWHSYQVLWVWLVHGSHSIGMIVSGGIIVHVNRKS